MKLKQIKNLSDVKKFALILKEEIGLGFHPDNSFEDYINLKTHEDLYTNDEALFRNSLIEQAFNICEKKQVDIYQLMGKIIVKGTPFKHTFK